MTLFTHSGTDGAFVLLLWELLFAGWEDGGAGGIRTRGFHDLQSRPLGYSGTAPHGRDRKIRNITPDFKHFQRQSFCRPHLAPCEAAC